MRKIMLLILAIGSITLFTACGASQENEQKTDGKLQVVTTFYPMYDFTKKIVGDNGDVSVLMTGETEPHDYEPSAKDIAKIQDADVFVYNSKEMETWVEAVLDSIDTKKTVVVEASQGIELMEMTEEADHEDHDHAHGVDPHIWLDPILAKKEVATIRDSLLKVDPANQESYQKNSDGFMEQLTNLDQQFVAQFKSATQRDFVTQHAAFGYLAARYDLHQVAISGISPDQEPSPAELATIEDFVKAHQVEIIFTEELSSDKIASTIAKATGAELATLNTLEGLSKAQQAAGEDYLSVMETNLANLSKAIR